MRTVSVFPRQVRLLSGPMTIGGRPLPKGPAGSTAKYLLATFAEAVARQLWDPRAATTSIRTSGVIHASDAALSHGPLPMHVRPTGVLRKRELATLWSDSGVLQDLYQAISRTNGVLDCAAIVSEGNTYRVDSALVDFDILEVARLLHVAQLHAGGWRGAESLRRVTALWVTRQVDRHSWWVDERQPTTDGVRAALHARYREWELRVDHLTRMRLTTIGGPYPHELALAGKTSLDDDVPALLRPIIDDLSEREGSSSITSVFREAHALHAQWEDLQNAGDSFARLTPAVLLMHGEICLLVGWLDYLLGRRAPARVLFERAGSVAEVLDDRSLEANVHLLRSFLTTQIAFGRGGRSDESLHELQLAERAAQRVQGPDGHALRATILARASEEHAAAGDPQDAWALFDRAAEMWYRGAGQRTARNPHLMRHGQINGYEGATALLLGSDRAVPALNRASQTMRQDWAFQQSSAAVDRSIALLRSGELERGCSDLAAAARIAVSGGVEVNQQRVDGALIHLVPWRREPVVRALYEELSELMG
jgi:hypothetical protein